MMAKQPLGKRKLPPPEIPRAARKPDWAWIRREWEADLKSTRAIAAQSTQAGKKVSHVAIEKHAKKQGWKKAPLTDEVKRQVANRLAVAAVTEVTGNAQADTEAVIDAAARQGVEVIRQHRVAIGRHGKVVNALVAELDDATTNVADLTALIEDETKAKPEASKAEVEAAAARRARLMRTIGLAARVTIAKDLAQALRHQIGLERQAFNLNDKDDVAPDSIEDRLAKLERDGG